jgi:molybdate transport system permease protein
VRFRRITILCSLAVLAIYGVLIASLFYFFDGSAVLTALSSKRVLFSIQVSLVAATVATGLALLVAVPAAYALSRYRFRGREAVDAILEFPIIVSPAALGAIILIFFSNPAGTWMQEHTIQFVFAFAGIVLAQFITVLGVAVRFIKSAFDQVPAHYETVARTLGASPARAFLTVCLPLARRGLLASGVLAWAKAMGEFGATITVAGTMAMRTETLPVAIFMRLSSADIEGTVALILVLLAIGLTALYAAKLLFRERGART